MTRAAPGIIPARAGFTDSGYRVEFRDSDHPRSRGVYGGCAISWSPILGSSPLARGLPFLISSSISRSRIIPARAGFTPRVRDSTPRRPDHPRSRGVYHLLHRRRHRQLGSSPLARGLLQEREQALVRMGIIPARAGFTGDVSEKEDHVTDHPRSRGVYAGGCACGGRGVGIIPARAGFTTRSYPRFWLGTDHPRSRGVYSGLRPVGGRARGSSPLARGLQSISRIGMISSWIIPARAGFTAYGFRR